MFLRFFLCVFSIYSVYAGGLSEDTLDKLISKLNSDRIEYLFGSFGIEVMELNSSYFPNARFSNLNSIDGNKKVMRTFAIVAFNEQMDDRLLNAHQEIQAGNSIGITLQKHGWKIEKVPVLFSSVKLSQKVRDLMTINGSEEAAVHVYRLDLSKDFNLNYCTIIEIHSPEYLSLDDLGYIYYDDFQKYSSLDLSSSLLLEKLVQLMDEF